MYKTFYFFHENKTTTNFKNKEINYDNVLIPKIRKSP